MARKPSIPSSAEDIDLLVAALGHPHEDAIQCLRTILREVDPRVVEEIKWNAPSFRITDHFATLQPRYRQGVQLILHFGAKKRDVSGLSVRDPEALLQWLGPDRASLKYIDLADLQHKRPALERLLRAWIAYV